MREEITREDCLDRDTQEIQSVLSASFADVKLSESPSSSGDTVASDREKPARVLIVDDHEAVRRGLRSALLGAGWQVCGEALNGREAIAKATELQPDLVILDVSMPVMGGLEAAPQILRSVPEIKVVAFTMHESQQIRDEMASLGVHGLAVKSAPLGSLLETIRNVLGS